MDRPDSTALACVPGAICSTAREALFALIRRLFREERVGMEELERGFEFSFLPSATVRLGEFMDNERRCCPFLKFEPAVDIEPWMTTLRLTGEGIAKEVVRHELGLREAA